jgi:hypothetical protein
MHEGNNATQEINGIGHGKRPTSKSVRRDGGRNGDDWIFDSIGERTREKKIHAMYEKPTEREIYARKNSDKTNP